MKFDNECVYPELRVVLIERFFVRRFAFFAKTAATSAQIQKKLRSNCEPISPANPDSGFAWDMGRQELMTSAKSHRPVIIFPRSSFARARICDTCERCHISHITSTDRHEDRTMLARQPYSIASAPARFEITLPQIDHP